ncbi:MAG: zinc-ribbon domain-containing protein [Clostridia bacterium]|nr:zinc-ribbon domain-containing protein [Clostridia bacterium]
MITCKQCGTQVEGDVKYCTNCGAPLEIPETSQNTSQIDLSEKFKQFNDTADTTAEFTAEDIEKNKVMALLAYIIFLIPLLAAKDSKFARFHTNQGIILFIGAVIASIIAAIPIIGWIIAPILSVIITVLAVIGIINAAGGKAKELPLVGKFKILK